MSKVLVTGAGGFIGYHLVRLLKKHGYWVRGVDLRYPAFGASSADEFQCLDLRLVDACLVATKDIEEVYALAADMGGIAYISLSQASVFQGNALINLQMLDAAKRQGVRRYLFASSACIYPLYLQGHTNARSLKESDAYPAEPQDAYGWEKLLAERALQYYANEFGIQTRVARLHNIYGPYGTYEGGREKAPAALCRKIALAKSGQAIEVWGDGQQMRSFCYIDDCIEGLYRLMKSEYSEPLNIGSDYSITIDELARAIVEVSGKQDIVLKHIAGPQGVRYRNSDNSIAQHKLNWRPRTSLSEGLFYTYRWIESMVGGK